MLRDYQIARKPKWMAVLNFILASFIVYNLNSIVNQYFTSEVEATVPYVVRVVANSNSEADQQLKKKVATEVSAHIETEKLYNESLQDSARSLYNYMNLTYPQIAMEVSVGQHLIPPKLVDNRLYPQAEKPSIVIKLGNGRGDNWFCSVFPHTCEPELEEDKEDEEDEEPIKWYFMTLWEKIQDKET